jgi:hypothetical protein
MSGELAAHCHSNAMTYSLDAINYLIVAEGNDEVKSLCLGSASVSGPSLSGDLRYQHGYSAYE